MVGIPITRPWLGEAEAEAARQATGFVFTEGPLWHPDGFF